MKRSRGTELNQTNQRIFGLVFLVISIVMAMALGEKRGVTYLYVDVNTAMAAWRSGVLNVEGGLR